jgi:hypothetical protein
MSVASYATGRVRGAVGITSTVALRYFSTVSAEIDRLSHHEPPTFTLWLHTESLGVVDRIGHGMPVPPMAAFTPVPVGLALGVTAKLNRRLHEQPFRGGDLL